MPAAVAGSRNTNARVTLGAISLSNSAHFPLMLYSKFKKPVILPPGWAMLCTKPAPIGSGTFTNTIGMVRVACCSGATVTLATLTITSGVSAIIIGRILMFTSGGRSSGRGDSRGGLVLLGLGVFVLGLVGAFFGRLIMAAVSRQREYLADASAVQFTRNRDGIGGALKKIGGLADGS